MLGFATNFDHTLVKFNQLTQTSYASNLAENSMTYRCNQCGADLRTGDTQCSSCGKLFDTAVPPSEPSNVSDDSILSRSASHRFTEPLSIFDEPPKTYAPPPKPPRRMNGPAIGVGVLLLAAFVAWFGYQVVMKGPVGDVVYDQRSNSAQSSDDNGDYKAAYDQYSQMIAQRPSDYSAYKSRAGVDSDAGWWQKSIDDESSAIALTKDPFTRGDELTARGDANGDLARWKPAIRDYLSAIQQYNLDTDNDDADDVAENKEDTSRALSRAYQQHKDYALAISGCNKLIKYGHTNSSDYAVRAQCELSLGDEKDSESDFGASVAMDPSNTPSINALDDISSKYHHSANVCTYFQAALRTNPDDLTMMGSLGWYQYCAGQYAPAIETDKHALSLDSSQHWIIYNLALCYAVLGDKATATSLYAVALTNRDQLSGSIQDIENALASHPGSPVLTAALAQLKRGDPGPGEHVLPASITNSYTPAPPPTPQRIAAQLAPVDQETGYDVRPPADYQFEARYVKNDDNIMTADRWLGPTRFDDSYPVFRVRRYFDDGSSYKKYSLLQATDLRLADVQKGYDDFTSTTPKPIRIGGLNFMLVTYRGTWNDIPYAGSEAVCQLPGELIDMTTLDGVRYAKATLPMLAAAANSYSTTDATAHPISSGDGFVWKSDDGK